LKTTKERKSKGKTLLLMVKRVKRKQFLQPKNTIKKPIKKKCKK